MTRLAARLVELAFLAFLACLACTAAGCGSVPSLERSWSKRWPAPRGKYCRADELVADGHGGVYLQTDTPPPPFEGRSPGNGSDTAGRYRISAEGSVIAVEARDLDLERMVVEGRKHSVTIQDANRRRPLLLTARDRSGNTRWEVPFSGLVRLSAVSIDADDAVWVAGRFRRALYLDGRVMLVGPPHSGQIIVPRFPWKTAVTGPTIDPDMVYDGFVLRFDANGAIQLVKRFHTGMTFFPGAMVLAEGGVVLLASLTGRVPPQIAEASRGAIPNADHTALSLLLGVANDGSVTWAQPLDGPAYGRWLVRSNGALFAFVGKEDGICELSRWEP